LRRLQAHNLAAPQDAGGSRRREPGDRWQDPPARSAARGACRGLGLDRKSASALGAPLRCRRRVPRGTEGATVTQEANYELRIERTFEASAEEVFDAWTSPEVMRRWFHCFSDWETPVAEVDLRVGGMVRVVMRRPDGREAGMGGEYRLIERPHRLVM